jgi:hypothetical protein
MMADHVLQSAAPLDVLVLRFPQTSGSRQRSDRCADGGFASLLKNCCRSASDPEPVKKAEHQGR